MCVCVCVMFPTKQHCPVNNLLCLFHYDLLFDCCLVSLQSDSRNGRSVCVCVCVTQIFIVDGTFGFSEVGHFSKWLTLPISHAALSAHILKDNCNVHSVNAFGDSQQKEEKASVVWKSEDLFNPSWVPPKSKGTMSKIYLCFLARELVWVTLTIARKTEQLWNKYCKIRKWGKIVYWT